MPNSAQILLGTKVALDAVWRITLNAKNRIIRPRQAILGRDLLPKIKRSHRLRTTLLPITFFFPVPDDKLTGEHRTVHFEHVAHEIVVDTASPSHRLRLQ